MSASIRPMTIGDLEAAVVIERASFPLPWSRAMFADELSRADRVWIAAETGGRLCGYAGATWHADEAHIMNLAVESAHREQGLATALLSELLEQLVRNGVHRATLEVREHNDAALRLY
ncbi:MAG: ribosomal protein S18-alanine N-acetyltransferase, partial [Actinomycetota bacterium]|nr:ribosomal protein S18-alanine N-acetyltransferase [Actinomycetota bacterium]